ncbi:Sodium/iodide cotransporter-like [Homarus americanus]|uniref:Sodium/iodide cotransporter-like n=2 Tax=Homarus americanus TaxID=6706 RepID=A0A8J5MNH4_HOMAM|nr:Sodium/iodide cotransporter-like [Homarus americanus]
MGSILYVYNSIISAVTGPLVGIYLTGICAPWVNWKGAVTGFTVAFGFNIWLVTGKFLTVGGTPTLMPLSTVGCQDNLANATIGSLINNTTLTDIALMTTALPDVVLANITVDQMYEPKTIYDISYCYAGPTGVAITLVVSTFVSLFTGPNSPTDLREGVVYRPCARAYQSVWLLFKGCHTSTSTSFPPAAHSSVLHATNGITATKFINTPTS